MLEESCKEDFKCLSLDTLLWRDVISTNLKSPKDDREKGMPSDQPWLTRITPTALLGIWVWQPIEDMKSFGTDFEAHANWQGNVEKSAMKDFIARKAHTIALSKVRGTHQRVIRCKERLANCPEAILGQATINLNSQVWKFHEESLPKLSALT